MKRNIALIVMMFMTACLSAQYLVIDNSALQGISVPLKEIIFTAMDDSRCAKNIYQLDIDQDGAEDIEFSLECDMGGFGSSYRISLSTFNNFTVHIDTAYMEHYQYLNTTGQAVDTTRRSTIVKKYSWGDTIYSAQDLLSTGNMLLHYSDGRYPPCIYRNINTFLEDTAYIAFTKSNGDLYYLKIHVPYRTSLKLISAKTNSLTGDVNEIAKDLLFPNPARNEIYFKSKFDLAEIYSLQGKLLIKKELSGAKNYLNISNLQRGLYFVNLTKDNTTFSVKLLKE